MAGQRARPEGRGAQHPLRSQGPAAGRHRRQQPGDVCREQAALQGQGPCARKNPTSSRWAKPLSGAPGKDVTIVATSIMVARSLEAAQKLAQEGIELEVIDLRTLKPYDAETIIASVKKTGRLLMVHEAPLIGGFGGEIVAMIAQSQAFAYLEAPIVRLGGADVPIPYNPKLERAAVPQIEDIVSSRSPPGTDRDLEESRHADRQSSCPSSK